MRSIGPAGPLTLSAELGCEAERQEEAMKPSAQEKREQPRTRKYVSQDLRVSAYHTAKTGSKKNRSQRPGYARVRQPWSAPARLVDVSDGGLGIEMFEPLAAGLVVSLSGELHSSDFCMEIRACARVADCSNRDEGVYRIGLAFREVSYWNLNCIHELGILPGAPGS